MRKLRLWVASLPLKRKVSLSAQAPVGLQLAVLLNCVLVEFVHVRTVCAEAETIATAKNDKPRTSFERMRRLCVIKGVSGNQGCECRQSATKAPRVQCTSRFSLYTFRLAPPSSPAFWTVFGGA